MFAQQFLQPKLSPRRYAGVPYALQNNTVFRRAQNWGSDSDGWRTDNGIEFHSVGAETAKHLCNVVWACWLDCKAESEVPMNDPESWFHRKGAAYQKELLVILKQEGVEGWEMVIMDED